MAGRELGVARRLIRAARREVDPRSKWAGELAACENRLDEPMRVALAGTLKSGKSTLLNALIGEEIAPTDATECTRVVTWFRRSAAPRIDLVARGERRRLPVLRPGGRLTLDLGVPADSVERLTVCWPSSLLDDYTVIDTPGTSSNSRDVSERTLALLAPEDGPCEADAVVYLMRDLRDTDVQLLQRIQRQMTTGGGPLGVVGVLSRADEIDGGRGESLASAHRLSAALAEAPELRGLHQSFIPVSGLLALRGQTLRGTEFLALRALAAMGPGALDTALISAARFAAPENDLPVSAADRHHLVEAFGLFGIRMAVTMIRNGCGDAPALSRELVRHSGLDELRRTLNIQFGQRNEQLRAHAALSMLARVLSRHPTAATPELSNHVARLLADTHMFTELRLLSSIRATRLSEDDRARATRVLGGTGTGAQQRLALPADASMAECRAVALRAIDYWRGRLDNPLLDPVTATTCRAAARSCEAIVATNG
ncbi:dynamin family protein [Nocardia sp. NPDC051570]|uniref:dynamin family protein n=1 Tax=Nocardia sp. NPDC051570 TaxID=3364324 RepID=UPI0037A3D5DA